MKSYFNKLQGLWNLQNFLSLRLRISVLLLIAMTLLGSVSLFMLTKLWSDLTRTNGLRVLSSEMKGLIAAKAEGLDLSSSTSSAEWMISTPQLQGEVHVADAATPSTEKSFQWLKSSESLRDADKIAEYVLSFVRSSKLATGSFEVRFPEKQFGKRAPYFVVFEVKGGNLLVAGSRAEGSLWNLRYWAAPIFGAFSIVFFVSALVSTLLASGFTRSYRTLSKAVEDISAGRYSNLKLEKTWDPELQVMVSAVQKLAGVLNFKDESLAKITQAADHDQKTGLPNYRAFERKMLETLKNPFMSDHYPVMVILDLDHFKKVNDTYGHLSGDEVLKCVAAVLKNRVVAPPCPVDFYARYGGEEFAGIVWCKKDNQHVLERGRILLQDIKKIKVGVQETAGELRKLVYSPSASIGVAPLFDLKDIANAAAWIKLADDAVYIAKRTGRSRVVLKGTEELVLPV